jgi:hypothetical protein
MMEPEKIMDGISKELMSALKAMSNSKDVNEKVAYSEIINNLCTSLGVFLDAASSMMEFDEEE